MLGYSLKVSTVLVIAEITVIEEILLKVVVPYMLVSMKTEVEILIKSCLSFKQMA